MRLEGAKETDVRAEIAEPLLAALGYRRGTPNDISREVSLTYARQSLGRKKPSDPPLRGRADFVLAVLGAGRWVLETKPPHEPIDVDAIEQAITYARHPDISAAYAVILNGVRLTVHHTSQTSAEKPLVDLTISDVASLAKQLAGLLSPAAVRRDCTPPIVDLGSPLAEGLRSRVSIQGGQIRHGKSTWSVNIPLPDVEVQRLDEMCRRLGGLRIAITGGTVYRDSESRIRAKLQWSMPHDELLRFVLDKKLMDIEYIALADEISTDPDAPSVFDVIGDVEVSEGETLFNIATWETTTAGASIRMRYTGSAVGFFEKNVFHGVFSAHYYSEAPLLPGFRMAMETGGVFEVVVDEK
ncbi:MAG TPA: hypothetical protein PK224_05115 [Nitrospira sp.]|nr:hypothetical protein [Nitrospira sp.]